MWAKHGTKTKTKEVVFQRSLYPSLKTNGNLSQSLPRNSFFCQTKKNVVFEKPISRWISICLKVCVNNL